MSINRYEMEIVEPRLNLEIHSLKWFCYLQKIRLFRPQLCSRNENTLLNVSRTLSAFFVDVRYFEGSKERIAVVNIILFYPLK